MDVISFPILGPLLMRAKVFKDSRGFFTERFHKESFAQQGIPVDFCQENFSRSHPGVLRGLHYQHNKPQGKLVTCTSGRIFDVAVDLRKQSETFGQYISVELSSDEPAWFWIPAGFAHGFCVLGDEKADLLYKVDNYYNPQGEGGLLWSDKDLGISWPIQNPLVSDRDAALPNLRSFEGL